MFLTETMNNNIQKYDVAKTEASFLYEAVLEANEAYHDICMKMIKCEHHCIVTENAQMLAEAEGEAKKSFKEIVMTLLKKIKEALINFKNFMVEQLAKLAKLIARVVTAPVRGAINIVGGIRALRAAKKDIELICAMNSEDDIIEVQWEEIVNEADESVAGEAVDARQAVNESKGIFEKLKAAVAKLNFFKATAEKAANDPDDSQAHKRLTKVSSAISKGFAKIRNAFKVAASAVWSALKAAGKAVADTAKKAAGAVKSKVGKKKEDAVAAESVEPMFFLEDYMYEREDAEPLNENVSIMTPVHLMYEAYTGHSFKRLKELEKSYDTLKNESQRNRLEGRIRRSISTANHALDPSFIGQLKKLTDTGIVGIVIKNLDSCKAKTREYIKKLEELLKKVEAKKF